MYEYKCMKKQRYESMNENKFVTHINIGTTNPTKCPLGVTSIKVHNNGSQSKARINNITNTNRVLFFCKNKSLHTHNYIHI